MSHLITEDLNICHPEEADDMDDTQWHVKSSRRKESLNKRPITKHVITPTKPLEEVASGSGFGIICSAFISEASSTTSVEHRSMFQCIDSPVVSNGSWPNVAEAERQKLRVLKDRHSNESFAQKLQAGSCRKNNTLYQTTVKTYQFQKNLSEFQKDLQDKNTKSESFDNVSYVADTSKVSVEEFQKNNEVKTSLLDVKQQKTITGKKLPPQSLSQSKEGCKTKKKRPTRAQAFPPQDSHVCIIDSSQRERWLSSEPLKQPVTKKCPPLLEKDFPDLSSALKLLSKCAVSHNSEDEDEGESRNSRGKKQRKNQPRWRDPISVNIIDILKESSDASTKISSSITRRVPARDLERLKLGGNTLDSSNPIRKRGKHRETPPKKRPSKLKHIILSERLKKQEWVKFIQKTKESNYLSNEDTFIDSASEGLTLLQIRKECPNDHNNPTSPIELEKQHLNFSEGVVSVSDTRQQFLINEYNVKDSTDIVVGVNDKIQIENLKSEILPIISSTVINGTQQKNVTSCLHSRKFRDYCDNIRSRELDEAVTTLLRELYRFQDRHYQRDPIRAHAKRRFVLGIREVKKYLFLKKLKAVVIAPDLEPVKSPGGLDDTVVQIREEGRTQQIPVIFAVGRRQLGFALMKKVPISIIGIINPEGAEEFYREVLDQWHSAAHVYQEKILELSSVTESI